MVASRYLMILQPASWLPFTTLTIRSGFAFSFAAQSFTGSRRLLRFIPGKLGTLGMLGMLSRPGMSGRLSMMSSPGMSGRLSMMSSPGMSGMLGMPGMSGIPRTLLRFIPGKLGILGMLGMLSRPGMSGRLSMMSTPGMSIPTSMPGIPGMPGMSGIPRSLLRFKPGILGTLGRSIPLPQDVTTSLIAMTSRQINDFFMVPFILL